MKNTLNGINDRLDIAKEKIRESEDIAIETSQNKIKTEKRRKQRESMEEAVMRVLA